MASTKDLGLGKMIELLKVKLPKLMGALLIFIIRTKFYAVLGKLRKQNTKRNDNRIQMGCELEKPNLASFGSTAVKTDSGTTAIHLVVSMMPIVATELKSRIRAYLRAGKKEAQAGTRGHIFIHLSLYLAEVTFREH